MKKLKVILPAILTLAVSTSAAVTGTVAWFTAARLREVAMDGVVVVDPEAGLDVVSVTDVANTRVKGDAQNGFSVTHSQVAKVASPDADDDDDWRSVYLRDASVDVANNVVYRGNLTEDGEQPTAFTAVDRATVGVGNEYISYKDVNNKTYNNVDVVYATQFTITFKTNAAAQDDFNYGLFLDFGTSTVTAPTTYDNGSTAIDTEGTNLLKALRFGFKTTEDWVVWAPLNTTIVQGTPGAGQYQATYVAGASTVQNYAEGRFQPGRATPGTAAATTVPDDTSAPANKSVRTENTGYLGVLNTTGFSVTVTTWFEGTDTNCVSSNFKTALNDVMSNLQFKMRRVNIN